MREEDEGNFNKNGFGRSFDVMSSEDKRVFQNLTDEGFRSVTQMEREIEGVMDWQRGGELDRKICANVHTHHHIRKETKIEDAHKLGIGIWLTDVYKERERDVSRSTILVEMYLGSDKWIDYPRK